MKKKLSVVIPTLNRLELLKITLHHLLPQIKRNLELVDFQISINASEDETESYLKLISKKETFINFTNFDERVGISDSFSRSINLCNGEFVIIYGDDDIPSPYFIENILAILNDNENVGLVHFNRVVGSDTITQTLNKLRLEDNTYSQPSSMFLLSDFIHKYSISSGFISSMVFKRDCWDLGKDIDNSTHYGFEFLSRIYAGINKLDYQLCIYVHYPMLIQRLIKKREWNHLWPKYWLIGVPSLLNTLDKEKITNNVIETWYKKLDKSTIKFIYYLLWASSYRKIYKPLIQEINKNQKGLFRKSATILIINFSPKFVFNIIRKIIYKQ